jgi:hypothetical protein
VPCGLTTALLRPACSALLFRTMNSIFRMHRSGTGNTHRRQPRAAEVTRSRSPGGPGQRETIRLRGRSRIFSTHSRCTWIRAIDLPPRVSRLQEITRVPVIGLAQWRGPPLRSMQLGDRPSSTLVRLRLIQEQHLLSLPMSNVLTKTTLNNGLPLLDSMPTTTLMNPHYHVQVPRSSDTTHETRLLHRSNYTTPLQPADLTPTNHTTTATDRASKSSMTERLHRSAYLRTTATVLPTQKISSHHRHEDTRPANSTRSSRSLTPKGPTSSVDPSAAHRLRSRHTTTTRTSPSGRENDSRPSAQAEAVRSFILPVLLATTATPGHLPTIKLHYRSSSSSTGRNTPFPSPLRAPGEATIRPPTNTSDHRPLRGQRLLLRAEAMKRRSTTPGIRPLHLLGLGLGMRNTSGGRCGMNR